MTFMCGWKVSLFETGVSNYFEESPCVGRFVHLLYLHNKPSETTKDKDYALKKIK